MYLGLDLRGGVHFMLQVDMQAALTKRAESFSGRHPLPACAKRTSATRALSRNGQTVEVRFGIRRRWMRPPPDAGQLSRPADRGCP
jgi:preprotein translocase subunit SecD